MTPLLQILSGTVLLALCALIHVAIVALSIPVFGKIAGRIDVARNPRLRILTLLSAGIVAIVLAHTIQIWVWSVTFLLLGSFEDLATSFYFATVTYTTLGYGDIVLGGGQRIVATFASITGLLAFGISTAFLMGLLVRVMPDVFDQDKGV